MSACLIDVAESPLQVTECLKGIGQTELILFLFVELDGGIVVSACLIDVAESTLQGTEQMFR